MNQSTPLPPSVLRAYQEPPQKIEVDGSPTWILRGAHFVIALTRAHAGCILERVFQTDEYLLLLPPGVSAKVDADGETLVANGNSLTIVPPGPSQAVIETAGEVVRVFSGQAEDLLALASNAEVYRHMVAAEPEIWPEPHDGFRLRYYDLSAHGDVNGPLIQPRIYRSANLMLNAFVPFRHARPTNELRPHWHDDFEQASVALSGNWIHHIRTPWGNDLAGWREDEHLEVGSPSIAIIPETLIHATRNFGDGEAWLLDVFGPPRLDFCLAGLVINGDEYPLPSNRDIELDERLVPNGWRRSST
ncbi:cupin domain-containing protein [Stutzerimonas azotifigens]|uniref:hypothetical protein n=1 Tax=Stutzerimonas azotifigens TaxID=291995 RepID=UPI0012683A92|nr:hypothetical protein [Stutzerimonas azotifigens]